MVWYSIYDLVPANNQKCFIRIISYYGDPVVAFYNSVQKRFETETTVILVPAYFVARWKPF